MFTGNRKAPVGAFGELIQQLGLDLLVLEGKLDGTGTPRLQKSLQTFQTYSPVNGLQLSLFIRRLANLHEGRQVQVILTASDNEN